MRAWMVVLVGCYRTPATPEAPKPACSPTVTLDVESTGGHALLDGKDLGLAVDHEEGKSTGGPTVYRHGSRSVLFAWTIYGHYGRPNGIDTLYEVDCVAKTAKPFVHDEGADFGHSALSADGKTLYFSKVGGVRALDLATRRLRSVTSPVTADCREFDEDKRVLLDAVMGINEDGTLIFEEGENCGFEGDWAGSTLYLDHPDRPGGKPYPPEPVTAVAVDAGGVVWASRDVALFRSSDRGEHWSRTSPILDATEEEGKPGGSLAPEVILPDRKRAGFVVVLTRTGGNPYMGPTELGLYVTRDAGQHWTPIPLPGGDGEPQLSAVALVNGSIDHLHAWGTVTRDAEAIDATWEWSNKGDDSEWTQLDDPLIKPKVAPAMLGGDEFRPSPHGVLRVPAGGGKPTRLFPN